MSAAAIEHARKGVYAPDALGGISEQRLSRFFGSVQGNTRISASIRERCVFAQHNLLKDPPFSHLDLLICQNVLIYLLPVAQKKSLQAEREIQRLQANREELVERVSQVL